MKVTIYDLGPKAFDRFTIVIEVGELIDFYGMSYNPDHPQGFNQYCGSNAEGYAKGGHLGKIREYGSLPDEVKTAILERLKGY